MGSIFAFIVFIILAIIIIKRIANRSEAVDKWQTVFINMQYSTDDFYRQVEEALTERQIPDVKLSREIFKEGSFASYQREYLQVSRKETTFHICAAPFGQDFFFSWWLRRDLSTMDEILMAIPVIGPALVKRRQYKTYYHWDTEAMFELCIKETVAQLVNSITEGKGIRSLTDHERAMVKTQSLNS